MENRRKEKKRKKVVLSNIAEKPIIEKVRCICGEMVNVQVYPDGWYVGSHDNKTKCTYWECGFK